MSLLLFMDICVVLWSLYLELVFSWVFTEYFPLMGFSSAFSLVDVGQHPPKYGCVFFFAPSSCVC